MLNPAVDDGLMIETESVVNFNGGDVWGNAFLSLVFGLLTPSLNETGKMKCVSS